MYTVLNGVGRIASDFDPQVVAAAGDEQARRLGEAHLPRARDLGDRRGRRRRELGVRGGDQVGQRLGDRPGGDELGAHLRHVGHVALRGPSDELLHELVELRRAQDAAGIGPASVACSWATFAFP